MSEAKGVMWKGEPVSSIQLPQSPNLSWRSRCDALRRSVARSSRARSGTAEPAVEVGAKVGATEKPVVGVWGELSPACDQSEPKRPIPR